MKYSIGDLLISKALYNNGGIPSGQSYHHNRCGYVINIIEKHSHYDHEYIVIKWFSPNNKPDRSGLYTEGWLNTILDIKHLKVKRL